jgi:hypothetical protein
MKQKLSALTITCFFCSVVMAQEFRLNGFASYVFDDHIESYYSNTAYYEGSINGGLRWGLGLEYMLNPTYGISLNYLRQDTKAPMTYYDNGVKDRTFDLSANWLMLNFTRYMKKNNLEPYGGAALGVNFFDISNPLSGESGSGTKFCWGIFLGSNIFFNERLGIKLQADLYSATQAVGGGFYFGTAGAGAGLSSYSTIYQFGLGGGIVIRFPKKTATTVTTQ